MSKILAGLAGLALMGAAAMPLPASAAPQGVSNVQSTEVSAQRQVRRSARHYSGPRRYVGPRYGYRNYGYRNYGYRDYGYGEPYGYYAPPPLVQFGVGPFGLRLF